jgi:glycine hydroxymethyltransferase
MRPSGIRLGTPALTTRGMKEAHMTQVAEWMAQALRSPTDEAKLSALHDEVRALCREFPVPGLEE